MTYWSRIFVAVVMVVINFFLFGKNMKYFWVYWGIYFALLVFTTIQAMKRMHDVNKSGWVFFIPITGFLILFWPGTKGANKYGDDPKEETSILGAGKD